MGLQDKRCALDVNILLDLADGKPFASAFLAVAQEKHAPLCLSPTAFIELEFLAQNGHTEQRKAAIACIRSLHRLGISVFDVEPVERGYTKMFAERLIRKSDRHLLDIPRASLS